MKAFLRFYDLLCSREMIFGVQILVQIFMKELHKITTFLRSIFQYYFCILLFFVWFVHSFAHEYICQKQQQQQNRLGYVILIIIIRAVVKRVLCCDVCQTNDVLCVFFFFTAAVAYMLREQDAVSLSIYSDNAYVCDE